MIGVIGFALWQLTPAAIALWWAIDTGQWPVFTAVMFTNVWQFTISTALYLGDKAQEE